MVLILWMKNTTSWMMAARAIEKHEQTNAIPGSPFQSRIG